MAASSVSRVLLPLPLPPLPVLIQSGFQTSLPNAIVPLPSELSSKSGRHLVLDRSRRRLLVLQDGTLLEAYPVAVGMPGWETPEGNFSVITKIPRPIWEHPEKRNRIMPGPDNPLGSRWIGFHRDCNGRDAHDGETWLKIDGCVTAGFHGTPHRWTVGLAVSHGCVRLYDEDVRALYNLVKVGTPVTVLP